MDTTMQDNEKNQFEERVLAYFDGALDERSSKVLLSEVASDTEKRVLFDSHAALHKLITAARVPLETPMEAKRALAEKIPGMLLYLPHVIGTAETIPLLTQYSNPILGFFSKMGLSTAISVGAGVAVLTTTAVVVKNSIDDKPAKTAVTRSVQRSAENPKSGLGALPKIQGQTGGDISIPAAGAGVAASGSASTSSSHSSNVASAVGHATNAQSNSATNSSTSSAAHSSTNSAANSSANLHAHVNRNGAAPLAKTGTARSTNASHVDQPALDTKSGGAATTASYSNSHQTTTTLQNSTDANAHNGKLTTPTPPESNHATVAASDLEHTPHAEQPLGEIPTTDPQYVANSTPLRVSNTALLIDPIDLPEESGLPVRPFVANGVKAIMLPTLHNASAFSNQKSATGVTFGDDYSIGMDVPVSDAFAVRLQAGNGTFAQIQPVMNYESAMGPLGRTIYDSYINVTSGVFTTAGLAYTVNPLDGVQTFAAVQGGIVWMDKAAPMVNLEVGSVFNVSSSFALRPSASFQGAWISQGQMEAGQGKARGVIEHRELDKHDLFNASIGVNLGLEIRY